MKSLGRLRRNKGKRGEREAAKALTALGLGPARRGQQHDGLEGRDVVHSITGVHIEIKRAETLSLYDALEQAQEDAHGLEAAIVLHRRNRKPWLVILELEDWIRISEAVVQAKREADA